MKSKVVILILCAVIAVTSITVLSGTGFFGKMESEISTESVIEVEPSTETFDDIEVEEFEQFDVFVPSDTATLSATDAETFILAVDAYINANDFALADKSRIENRFITTLTDYSMTKNDLVSVLTLIQSDYDIEKVLDVYEFLRWTNCDINAGLIEELYLAGIANSEDDFWLYDTYDHLFNRTEDILSVEDVAYYVNSGVKIDEIVGAYELSFAGVKNTKQMLSERLEGKTWNEIAATTLSQVPQTIESAPEMTINEIVQFRAQAIKMRKDISEIVTIEDGKVRFSEDALNQQLLTAENKRNYIEEFDAYLPVEKEKDEIAYSDEENGVIYNMEEDLEEYDIPVDEPEVE